MRKSNKKAFDTAQGKLEIEVLQLGGIEAAKLSVRLGKIVGPAVARFAGGGKNAGEVDSATFGAAAADLFDRLSEDELEYVTNKLLDGATAVSGNEFVDIGKNLDELFKGKVSSLYSLIQFALEVNFADFFDGLSATYKAAVTKQALSATTTSAGQPNG